MPSVPSKTLGFSAPVSVLLPAVQTVGTVTSAAVDLQTLDGEVILCLHSAKASAGTTPTLIVKVQDCDAVGGSYADVAGLVFSTVTDAADVILDVLIPVRAVQRFIKIVSAVAGSSASFVRGVSLRAVPKYGS